VQTGYRQAVHRAHWFDGNSCFHDTIPANHSKMDLSIRGHRLFKDGSPINVPTREDSAFITCDGEQKWLPIPMRRAHMITGINQWSAVGETRHGIIADFEGAMCVRSYCVAFCFSFRHSVKTVAQIS
jgi:hypothetical protein